MKKSYFKTRKPLNFSAHAYVIGSPVGIFKNYEDNHFLLKIYRLDEIKFDEYYNYHLAYTLENNIGSEAEFYSQVWQLVQNRIKHYETQDPFSRSHASHVNNIRNLQKFQKYLNRIDQWNARPAHLVIPEKEALIQKQKEEIEKLTARLSEINEYEVLQKISIGDNALPTLVDLLKQMSQLTLPSGRPFLDCDKKSPYSKMISKYFSQDGKDIPLETSRNYFVEKKGDIPIKGTTVRKEHHLFEIIPVKQAKK